MPRTVEQYEEIRKRRRDQIMSTALMLFAKEGYHKVPISKIAEKAKISKGLMYNYFSSKEDLIKSILNEGLDEMFSVFDPDRDGFLTDEEFEFFIRQIFDIIKKNRAFYKLYFTLFTQPRVYDLIFDRFNEVYESLIKTLIQYYERKGAEDPHSEALLFSATIDGIALNFIWNPKLFPLEDIIETVIKKFSYNHKA